MKKLAIIGAGDFQLPLIERAKALGYETHVFAWANGDPGETAADVFYPLSITEHGAIYDICQNLAVAGVCSIATDLGSLTVNAVARRLGLPCNTPDSARLTTNKYAMRLALAAAGDPVPGFLLGNEATLPQDVALTYPLIVKPTDRSGSRGITKIASGNELTAAIETALRDAFEKKVMIEEYVEGEEYSAEFISYGGEHHLLAITEKATTGAPHFIETGHRQPAPLTTEMTAKINTVLTKALSTLQIALGASHAEFKITPAGEIIIIEIGGRMGGDCIGSHLVPLTTGYDYLGMVIACACGQEPSFAVQPHPGNAEIRFLFSADDLVTYKQMAGQPDISITETRLPDRFDGHAVVDSGTRYGYYIFTKEEGHS